MTSANQGEAAQNEIYNQTSDIDQTSNEGRINIKQMPIPYKTAFICWVRWNQILPVTKLRGTCHDVIILKYRHITGKQRDYKDVNLS